MCLAGAADAAVKGKGGWRLAETSSPYLRMHRDNPVEWYPWGEEALARARKENKPLFISIGYFTCHWCHVMERESFRNPEIARLLNSGFISIKVDREQRPDLDAAYMSFVVATQGYGGWPMTILAAPDGTPFFGGTYFPPDDREGAPGFAPLLRKARTEGLRVTAETCPHYLTFAAEDIAAGATQFKCAPPLRDRANRERLWQALIAGDLQLIASDHSPCPPGMKAQRDADFMKAWGGISGLELSLAAVWTGLSSRGGGVERLCEWLCAAPARLAGFEGRKGAIAAGADADLVIWDPDASVTVDGDRLHHRHKLTPYHGMTLRGRVDATLIRGHLVHERGMVDNAHGRLH